MSLILITGGAGFIGSHTADALHRDGHRVRLLDCLDPQIHGAHARFPDWLSSRVECLHGDVCNPSDLDRALDGVDAVCHFAALTGVGQSMYDLGAYYRTNVTGTSVLLETLLKRQQRLSRLVLASSRAVYGEGAHSCPNHGSVHPAMRKREDLERGLFGVFCPLCGSELTALPTCEDSSLSPASVYAWTKKHQEDLCLYAAQAFGMPVTILRYFNVYGSRQSLNNPYTGIVSIFYSRLLSGQPISIYERGEPTRDFVHVSDVVQANVLALRTPALPGSRFNVGSGMAHRIPHVANALSEACARPARLVDRGEFRVGDIHSCFADISRARNVLGYAPRMGLREGLAEFACWARGQVSTDLYQHTVDELRRHGLFGQASGNAAS